MCDFGLIRRLSDVSGVFFWLFIAKSKVVQSWEIPYPFFNSFEYMNEQDYVMPTHCGLLLIGQKSGCSHVSIWSDFRPIRSVGYASYVFIARSEIFLSDNYHNRGGKGRLTTEGRGRLCRRGRLSKRGRQSRRGRGTDFLVELICRLASNPL